MRILAMWLAAGWLVACREPEPRAPEPVLAPAAAPTAPPAASSPPVASGIAASVHVALGIPRDADDSDDTLLDRGELVISYNARLNAPNWVAWHLGRADLGTAPRSSGFHPDLQLPPAFYVVRDEDYSGSGYDRGHLCPSADRTSSPDANRTTFVLSNAHPQWHALNAGPWEKLETHERELVRQGKELFVVAGGLFAATPPRIGKQAAEARRVAVPLASYKVVIVLEPGQRAADVTPATQAFAVIMPNRNDVGEQDYGPYLTSIRAVETASGYDFDRNVPQVVQDAIETRGTNGKVATR